MVIENKVNGIIRLFADEGKKITNSERAFFSDFIYLGKNDSPDNYEEVGREIWKHFIEEENPDVNELKEKIKDLQEDRDNLEMILLDTNYRLTCMELGDQGILMFPLVILHQLPN